MSNIRVPGDQRWPVYCRVCDDWCRAAYDWRETKCKKLEPGVLAKVFERSLAHSLGRRFMDDEAPRQ